MESQQAPRPATLCHSCLPRTRSVDAESGAYRFGTQCICVLVRLAHRFSFFFLGSFGLQCTGRKGVRRHLVRVSCVRWSLFHSDPARSLPGTWLPTTQKSAGHEGHRHARLDFLNYTVHTVPDPSWLATRPLTPHVSHRRRRSTRPPRLPRTQDRPRRRDAIATTRSPTIFSDVIFPQLARSKPSHRLLEAKRPRARQPWCV